MTNKELLLLAIANCTEDECKNFLIKLTEENNHPVKIDPNRVIKRKPRMIREDFKNS